MLPFLTMVRANATINSTIGERLSAVGGMAESFGAVNPLRYRGYVYDREIKFFYLQSRYYDPELGRFINADAYASTGQGILGNNMFAYCLNDPVILVDNSGNAAHICFGYDGQRDESPWKIGSPGGGGWPQGLHYSQQDYGSVADKFLTVRVLKLAFSASTFQFFHDIYTNQLIAETELWQINNAEQYERFTDNPRKFVSDYVSLVGDLATVVGLGATVGMFTIPVWGQVALGLVGLACGFGTKLLALE